MFNHVFRYFGIPEDIVSDRGPQFISRVWKNFLKLLGVTVSLSSGYHPQTNGQMERKIQEIGRFLRTFCHGHQHSWNQFMSTNHWTHSLPVRARFPATFVPLGWGTIRCTCSRLLVPREQEGLGRSTPPSSTSYCGLKIGLDHNLAALGWERGCEREITHVTSTSGDMSERSQHFLSLKEAISE